ncbi:MAG: NAD-glutamate dehydrogenase [Pseudomonadales bacterium]
MNKEVPAIGDSEAQIRILQKQIEQRLTDTEPLLSEFVRLWWSRIPAEDLLPRLADDDAGASIDAWQAFRRRDPNVTEIHVCNPELATDGWHSKFTVVRVMTPDMPFVTDSVLMALSHDGLVTHHLGNVVLATERDDEGMLTSLRVDGSAEQREVFIFAEIDRLPNGDIPELENRLRETLGDVRAAVSDFQTMKDRLNALREDLRRAPPPVPRDDLDEAIAFLEWMAQNNFTFLGFRSFDYDDGVIRQTPDSALGILRNRHVATPRRLDEQSEPVQNFLLQPRVLSFSQSGTKARMHRPAYPDYIGIRKFDANGNVIGEHGFLGLFTSRVYREDPQRIPVVRRKVTSVLDRSGLDLNGFDGKVLHQVLATYPKDELFQTDADALFQVAMGITYIHERRRTRLFVRYDPYGLFVHCLVYLPRDLYSTDTRMRITELLSEAFDAVDNEFEPYFSESILVRLQLVLRIRPGAQLDVDLKALEARLIDATRDWTADFQHALTANFGEAVSRRYARTYALAFPASYRERYSMHVAVTDVTYIERLDEDRPILTMLYRRPEEQETQLHLKIFLLGAPLPLSDVITTLENLGLRARAEHPFVINREGQPTVSLLDFDVSYPRRLDLRTVSERFDDAFVRIRRGDVDDDQYNRLILAAGLDWRQANLLRTYGRYLQQIRFGFSQRFITDTLHRYPQISAALAGYFEARFDPDGDAQDEELARQRDAVLAELENVALLNEDRVLRRFLELFEATRRVNYFVRDADGRERPYLSLKLTPRDVANLPKPVPAFEIFVNSPRMEGVHLRGGPIARGGLRWSDRAEDYRTEVLGLVKAQAVKNAVIVPTGAKGGFIVRRPSAEPDVFRQQGVSCYQEFIRGLLDLTDNIVDGAVLRPPGVRCYDGDDPYLVVAADKGTATFSDIANGVAAEYGLWLGDAFASGGSHGYDHKAMGITARGAWVSVQRHFAERGIDVQSDPVSVLGIGDMSGDVFGNGLLRSESIRLLAAFNHLHIFVDPDPDPAASFRERQRLFNLPRSSWADYDADCISAGGGVFSRSAKSIPLSPEMRRCFQIEAERLSPEALIKELLKAPVDLIWNGGIGTYVKSAAESHEEVGDRANDVLRVDAEELRCKAFGEGGNLGMTQRARVAFALRGGSVNSDFIDNSAGVDCSDHEVNIKIALNQLVRDGELTEKHRNELLAAMTDEVAELVLTNNFRQAQVLSLSERQAQEHPVEFQRFIALMETCESLDRALEGLPNDEALAERTSRGGALVRPELAVLMAFAKTHIKNVLNRTGISADPEIRRALFGAFPATLKEGYAATLEQHPLAREIVSTQIANDIVHHMGITFVARLMEMIGASMEEIARAYLAMAACFGIRDRFRQIEQLSGVDAQARLTALGELVHLGRRATRWLLRHERARLDVSSLTQRFQPAIEALSAHTEAILGSQARARCDEQLTGLLSAGVPEAAARTLSISAEQASILTLVAAAESCNAPPLELLPIYLATGEQLQLGWLTDRLDVLPTASHWQRMERDALQDDMVTEQGRIAATVYREAQGDVSAWLARHPLLGTAWNNAIEAAQHANTSDFSLFAVTCRKLMDLARNA